MREHEPGDDHRYRIECEVCGERGTVTLSVEPQRAALAAEPAGAGLDADRLTAIIESRMSRDLAWLRDDGKTVDRFGPEQVAWALAHLYQTGDVVSGLPALAATPVGEEG